MWFVVRVSDVQSQQVHEVAIEATDAAQARQRALKMRYLPLAVQPRRAAGRGPAVDLVLFAEELRILLDAGIPLIEAIEGLSERGAALRAHEILRDLVAQLHGGARLSAALERHPADFPPLFVGIVRSAETTSDLPQALGKYLAYAGHMRTVREQVVSAALYPAILLAAGLAVSLFLMLYVVPRFAAVYQAGGRALPWASQLLLDFGALVQHRGWLVLLCFAILAALGWRAYAALGSGPRWVALLMRAPGCKHAAQTISLSRLYRTMAMLLDGGIAVRDVLQMARAVVDAPQAQALERARRMVEGGQSCSAALGAAGLATPLALRMIRVGERSGSLGEMLARTAQFHEHETTLWVERFTKVVAPLFMIGVSLAIGTIVIFLYMPIFGLAAGVR